LFQLYFLSLSLTFFFLFRSLVSLPNPNQLVHGNEKERESKIFGAQKERELLRLSRVSLSVVHTLTQGTIFLSGAHVFLSCCIFFSHLVALREKNWCELSSKRECQAFGSLGIYTTKFFSSLFFVCAFSLLFLYHSSDCRVKKKSFPGLGSISLKNAVD
jgi:hypothetical protein